ncbi:hypothetical protein [Bradyrhizobium sp. SZCCHNS2096]|uniref:BrnT family toxin n=1 Tax=Bradyrhizobium sp. SZCCHNS2096 TaxID=3057309 RepID=UPI0039678796
MKILWDEPKRIANIAKHRLDFANLTEEFFANALVLSAKGGRDPSDRNGCKRRDLGVFAVLGLEGLSVISMRPASKKERKLFNAKS